MTMALVRTLFYIVGAFAIVAFSFWATLTILGNWSIPVSSPNAVVALPPATRESRLADLPPSGQGKGFLWLGIAGLNVQIMPDVPVVAGQRVLRLVALKNTVHTLAVRLADLDPNRVYRITAWIKSQAGANFAIAARDRVEQENGPNNGMVVFDVPGQKVVSSEGVALPGMARDHEGWQEVWIDLRTSDGTFVVNFYVARGTATTYAGDGELGITLGGVEVARKS